MWEQNPRLARKDRSRTWATLNEDAGADRARRCAKMRHHIQIPLLSYIAVMGLTDVPGM